MNYNFKLLWERECMPLMNTNQFKKIIEKGINAFMKNERELFMWDKLTDEEKMLNYINKKEYKKIYKQKEKDLIFDNPIIANRFKKFVKGHYPLNYSLGDSICDIEFKTEKKVISFLLKRGILLADKNLPKIIKIRDEEGRLCEDFETDIEDYFETENYKNYEAYKNKIIEPYLNVERSKNYKYYCVWRACHFWNTTFCLELAKMVMPSEEWVILQNHRHSTITNKDESLVFDILYYDETDKETYGGKFAISEAKNTEPNKKPI